MTIKHTPGPWAPTTNHDLSIYGEWDDEDSLTVSATKVLRCGDGELAIVVIDMNLPNTWDDDLLDANTRLIAAAPDHAMIGWAMCVGSGRWEPWGGMRGEFVMNGIRHATKLDAFGVPEVTPAMRAAIAKAHTGASS